jgi:iron(III) transport system permease protein
MVAYMASFRRMGALNRYLELVGTMPSAIPGTLLGIAFILAFAGPPFALAGTLTIIILNNVVRFLPLSLQSYKSVLTKIDQAIEENSVVLGAGALTTMARVILPLASVGFLSSFVYAFIKSMNTVSAVIFLESPSTRLLAPFILGLGTHGYWGQAAALSTLIIATVISFFLLLRLTLGRRVRVFEELL